MAKVETPDAVCCEEERKFWVSFRKGHIKVGYKDTAPFMEWTDPEPWKVSATETRGGVRQVSKTVGGDLWDNLG